MTSKNLPERRGRSGPAARSWPAVRAAVISSASMAPGAQCVACGAGLTGRYCAECGEAAGHHDYSLKHFAEEALETFVHVDGRIFSTFRSLVTRPGELASEFLAGRRRSQIGPLQLFVICNLIYFLTQPFTIFAPFTSTLRIQTTERPWGRLANAMVESRMAARQVTREAYARAFDETAHLQGKSLVILMVPLFALGAWLLFGRSRRFYAEHLVFAFYVFAFLMLWMAVSTVALTKPVLMGLPDGWSDALITLPFVAYLVVAVRRAFAEPSWPSVLKALALTGWLIAVLTAYRFVLFFTTFYAT
jgi:hypothetical protein